LFYWRWRHVRQPPSLKANLWRLLWSNRPNRRRPPQRRQRPFHPANRRLPHRRRAHTQPPTAVSPPPTAVPTSQPTASPEPEPAFVAGRTTEGAFFLGAVDAPVTMIDYSDFL
jgi:hypothetical protein